MIRVLLADDHAIVRGGLKEILIRHLESVECGEAENAEQVLAQVRKVSWDLLILDITMPGRSGFDILADLRLLRPDLPVLILSMLPEDQFGKQALKAGACGYLKKEAAPHPGKNEHDYHRGTDTLRSPQPSCGLITTAQLLRAFCTGSGWIDKLSQKLYNGIDQRRYRELP